MLLGYGRAQAMSSTERFRGVTSEIASGRTRKIALVAQRIEHWPPAPGVAGSIPAEGADSFESLATGNLEFFPQLENHQQFLGPVDSHV